MLLFLVMQKINPDQLKQSLDTDLCSQRISGRILLDRFSVIEEDSRKTAAYLDHKYASFYYYLGKYVAPISVMEIGFSLGLLSASFFISCRDAKKFLGFKETTSEFVTPRLGKRNIRSVFKKDATFYTGTLYDQEFDKIFSPNSWDLIILNEETVYDKHLEYLEFVWPHVSEHGFVVAEYITRHGPAKDAFFAFAESKNRQPLLFETRYGTGLLQK